MDELLTKAVKLLGESGASCVLLRGDRPEYLAGRGVGPLTDALAAVPQHFAGCAAADKIIGRAAALLFLYGGVGEVYGEVMSRGAMEMIASNGIPAAYGTLAEQIRNRAGDGICPMEKISSGITSPEEAYRALSAAVARMRQK